jgi:hypothetical protein
MDVHMTPDGTIAAILSDRDRDGWQTAIPEIHHAIRQRVVETADALGLTGDIHIFFPNGAHVCTLSLKASFLVPTRIADLFPAVRAILPGEELEDWLGDEPPQKGEDHA